MGRKRMNGNHIPGNNNSIENSVAREESGYPAPDLNKTIINVTKVPVMPTRNPSKMKS
jgi:hypothetical protein